MKTKIEEALDVVDALVYNTPNGYCVNVGSTDEFKLIKLHAMESMKAVIESYSLLELQLKMLKIAVKELMEECDHIDYTLDGKICTTEEDYLEWLNREAVRNG